MPEPRFKMKKIWTDVDFFEVNLSLSGTGCTVDMDFYIDNSHLEELRDGVRDFANTLGKSEFTWVTGSDTEDTTHFLSMRFYLNDKRGMVGIEFTADNKLDPPDRMKAHFYMMAEINQVDDFIWQLDRFIRGDIFDFESLS
ncbi:hypothetical protein FIU87_03300 [Bacillus sp. THAF10]|uniref:hypothetical protein n=1 Tax=Bacillus sp. THAF10 TaxID=2587848 RepID=UPI00126835F1|nr:hypothetical protein [Bacillus sp. THAF10]QFT87668.1 hypothetical protein FIU87_03300 [Bacillus sp. THAF10]